MTSHRHSERALRREMKAQRAGIDGAIRAHQDLLMPYLPVFGWAHDGLSPGMGKAHLFDMGTLKQRIQEVRTTDRSSLLSELRKAEQLGAERTLAKPPCPAALKQLRVDFPHFDEVLDLIDRHVSLANLSPGQEFGLPPILLAGDPGVGKTAFSEALAAVLEQPLGRVDLASTTSSFTLSGAHETWAGAKHGEVWALLQSPSASGILLLEEIDKAGGGNHPPLGPLYSLLESHSSRCFKDEFVQVPVDASYLTIVATCNDDKALDSALQSRFRKYEIPLPTVQQMPAIVKSVYRSMRKSKRWGAMFSDRISDAVIGLLTGYTPRQLSRAIEDAAGHAASCGRTHISTADVKAVSNSLQMSRKKTPIGFTH